MALGPIGQLFRLGSCFLHALNFTRAAEPELGILPGAGAQIKNQEPEPSLKFRTGAGAMAFER